MQPNSEFRALARQSLSGKRTMLALVTLLFLVISGASGIGIVTTIFIFLPINFSVEQLFLRFVRGEEDNLIEKMFDGFKCYGQIGRAHV